MNAPLSLWERASSAWEHHVAGLNADDKSAASSLFLFLILPLVPAEVELPDAVREGMGRVLHRAGATEGDAAGKLDAFFRAHPLSPAAQAALGAFLDAFLPDVDVEAADALGAQLDRLGVATSSRPVGASPPPEGSVRGGLAARLQQTKSRRSDRSLTPERATKKAGATRRPLR